MISGQQGFFIYLLWFFEFETLDRYVVNFKKK